MSKIYFQDFNDLKSESLKIDYLRWNLVYLKPEQIFKIASYFKNLGFNAYLKDRDTGKRRQEIHVENRNLYEVVFILKINYQTGTHIEFSGASGNRIFDLIKNKRFQLQKLIQYEAILGRVDICYDREHKPTDIISDYRFINDSLQQFQESHPNRNLTFYKNQESLMIKVGNRQSNRHYRVYSKNNKLRFEFELKDKKKLKFYQSLLQESNFEDFEKNLAHQFFKYSFQIFTTARQPDQIDWLFCRIRPYQYRDNLTFKNSTLHLHYINQSNFKKDQEKKDFITLLQLLTFVGSLDFEVKTLMTEYRIFKFSFRDFLGYAKGGRKIHYYQIKQFKEFLQKPIIIESFTDTSFRSVVTIPELEIYQSKNNQLFVEMSIANGLFEYLCPFLYRDYFKENLNKYQFKVLFEIIKVLSSTTTRKEFNIKQFLKLQGPNLNGNQKKKIKDYFIRFLNEFQSQGKIYNEVVFPLLNSQSKPKSNFKITQLKSEHLSETLVVFEIVNVKFS